MTHKFLLCLLANRKFYFFQWHDEIQNFPLLVITMRKDCDQWSIIIEDQHITTMKRQDVLTVAAFLIRTIITISFTVTNPAGMDTLATIVTQFLWTFTSRTSSGTIVFIGEVTTVIVTITCPILVNAFFVSARKLIWGTCLISYWKILRKKVRANLNHLTLQAKNFWNGSHKWITNTLHYYEQEYLGNCCG